MRTRALAARFFALVGPLHIAERRALCDELEKTARDAGARSLELLAHEYRFGCLLLVGDFEGADREVEALAVVGKQLHRADDAWLVSWFRAARALSDGRFADAERLAGEGFETAQRAHYPAAEVVFGGIALWLALQRGRYDEFAAGLGMFVGYYPWAARVGRAGSVLAHAEAGRTDAARELLAELARGDFAELPIDEHWLVLMTLLGHAAARVNDVHHAKLLRERLLPHASLLAVHDLSRLHAGPVALAIGMLETTLGMWSDAAASLANALALAERIGSQPYVARARVEQARLVTARGA